MKLRSALLCVFTCILSIQLHAQKHRNVSKEELKTLISTISDSLEYYYASVEEGIEIGNYLKKQYRNGEYNNIKHPDSLAARLTKDLRMVTNDLHLYVFHNRESETINTAESQAFKGLKSIEFYNDGIVYMAFTDFGNWNNANDARQTITNIISVLQEKKALIIDVRNNLGGVPYVVSYLMSYFFEDTPRKLANYFIRYNNSSYSIYTEPNIAGNRYPDIPIYVLVNNKTASAGEELAFWLQGQDRATIIGQNTIGAGYGAMEHRLNDRFLISISNETEVDPITNKGFQITGVKPDIITKKGEGLNKALELAAKDTKTINDHLTLDHLRNQLDSIMDDEGRTIPKLILKYHDAGVIDYSSINQLGYDFIQEPQKAVAILKMNTILYPFYPNSFDSYADALFANRDYLLAEENYEKAIELATLKSNMHLEMYKDNLNNFHQKYSAILKEENAIKATLHDYIEGTSNGEIERLRRAFHKDLNLYSVGKDNQLKVWKGQDYIGVFKEGEKSNRIGEVLSIDFENNAAIAKVKITSGDRVYIDYFLLLKLKEGWKIIHKSYTRK